MSPSPSATAPSAGALVVRWIASVPLLRRSATTTSIGCRSFLPSRQPLSPLGRGALGQVVRVVLEPFLRSSIARSRERRSSAPATPLATPTPRSASQLARVFGGSTSTACRMSASGQIWTSSHRSRRVSRSMARRSAPTLSASTPTRPASRTSKKAILASIGTGRTSRQTG